MVHLLTLEKHFFHRSILVLIPTKWCQLKFGSQEVDPKPSVFTFQTIYPPNTSFDPIKISKNQSLNLLWGCLACKCAPKIRGIQVTVGILSQCSPKKPSFLLHCSSPSKFSKLVHHFLFHLYGSFFRNFWVQVHWSSSMSF